MNTDLVFNTCLLLQNLFILIMYLHVLIQCLYQPCGFMLIRNTITILILISTKISSGWTADLPYDFKNKSAQFFQGFKV